MWPSPLLAGAGCVPTPGLTPSSSAARGTSAVPNARPVDPDPDQTGEVPSAALTKRLMWPDPAPPRNCPVLEVTLTDTSIRDCRISPWLLAMTDMRAALVGTVCKAVQRKTVYYLMHGLGFLLFSAVSTAVAFVGGHQYSNGAKMGIFLITFFTLWFFSDSFAYVYRTYRAYRVNPQPTAADPMQREARRSRPTGQVRAPSGFFRDPVGAVVYIAIAAVLYIATFLFISGIILAALHAATRWLFP